MNSLLLLGASGYVGGELLRLLAHHPCFDVVHACAHGEAGEPVARVHPHLSQAYGEERFATYDPAMLQEADLVLAALPHGATQALAPAILDAGVKFVDLGADFRLSTGDAYARWYKEDHQAPHLLDTFAYGIPELHRGAIGKSQAVAAAGCYATAAILAMKPLVEAGMVVPGTIVVNGMSGVSGAGKAASATTHFDHVHGSLKAYGLLSHRHTGEMEQELGSGVLFTPHLAPMDRGILVTCTAEAAHDGDPLKALEAAYANEPFVHVSDSPPITKAVAGSNAAHLTARRCERTGRLLALGAIDNLGKGAAGQMIQCANIMLGLDETRGLSSVGMWP